MARVLFVLTGSPTLTLKDGSFFPGGVWPPEFVWPHHAFSEVGYEITVATLGGVPAPIDEAGLGLGLQENDQSAVDFQRAYLARPEIEAVLAAPARLEDLDPADYDVVFVPGGFGVFEDVGDDPVVGRLIASTYARGDVVATLCSGGSSLLGARNGDGTWPFAGKRIAGFPTSEKIDFGVADGARYLLEDRMKAAGADYVAGEKHQTFVVVDGNLVTGQNGASSRETAQAVIELVEGRGR